jgi:membrane fusion protein, multidrug efflux system
MTTANHQPAHADDPVLSPPRSRVMPFPARVAESDRAAAAEPIAEKKTWRQENWPMKAIVAALLVAIVVGVVAWVALKDPAAKPGAAAADTAPIELAAVDVASVEPRVLSRALPLSGSIAPIVQATVKSKVAGEVQLVTLREGQDVSEGDVIARVDTRNLQAQYDRELAAVDKARADLQLSTLNRDKNRVLLEQKYISQNTYESTESAYAASVASLRLAEAQARLAKIDLDDTVIRAPFTGTIAGRHVQPGEKVSPDSQIVTLVDLRNMVLEAAVPAADIPGVSIGQKVRFTVGGFGERQFEGEVQRINPVTAGGSRAIMIYITVPNADRALKGGMFAKGEMTLDATQPVLAVAQRAVREDAGATYVHVLRNGKIVRTPITLGSSVQGNGFVEVREGLAAGDQVIVTDLDASSAGKPAYVRDPSGKASSGSVAENR